MESTHSTASTRTNHLGSHGRPPAPPTDHRPDLRVAVLMGGANTERNVSLSSGLAVAHALRSLGYPVAEVDSATPLPRTDVVPDEVFDAHGPPVTSSRPVAPTAALPPTADELRRLRASQDAGVLAPGVLEICRAADLVFLTVFGDEGESGATQAYLDEHGIAYTGPSAGVCAVTFDKARTKQALVDHGIRTPAGHVVRPHAADADLRDLPFGGPWIVKPVTGGSTIGLSLVDDAADLPTAVQRASVNGSDALIEAFVPGRDVTVGVLADEVFPVVETVTDRELYDYTAKYQPGHSTKRVPARISEAERVQVQALTRAVHAGLGIGDTSSRSDFRLDPHGRFWFFEVNPLPGLTPTSSYPISAQAAGISFPQLCHRLVQLAVRQRGRRVPR